jgi:hypothetical protein
MTSFIAINFLINAITDDFVKGSYTRHANLDGIPLTRRPKDAYDQYGGMTKDECNAVDESLANSSLLEEGCPADKGRRPLRGSDGMHMGVGGQYIFVNNPVPIFFDSHPPFHMKNQIVFFSGPI